jgi:hypothetical protein
MNSASAKIVLSKGKLLLMFQQQKIAKYHRNITTNSVSL